MDDMFESDLTEELFDSDLSEDLKSELSEELKYNNLIEKLIESDLFDDIIYKKNKNKIIIDIITPEIGTKKEYFDYSKKKKRLL